MSVLLTCLQMHAGLVFGGKEARLRLTDPSAQFVINSSLTGFSGTLQRGVAREEQMQGSSFIYFDGGRIEEDKTQSVFSGLYDPLANDVIRLLGNHSISLMNGFVSSPIKISGNGNKLDGFAFFSKNIELADAASVLEISLISPLNRSIILNGGTLALSLDLDFVQDATLVGNGIVDCKKNAIRFNQRASSWMGDLVFKNASIIQLRGLTRLSGSWTFTADSFLPTVIDGDDNVLDVVDGGSITIGAGGELVLINVALQGLGKGRIVFGDATSRLTLIGCTLEVPGGYLFETGQIVIKDRDVLAVVGENSISFGENATLTLDGANFVYDALTASNATGIKVAPERFTVLRYGEILARVQDANGPAILFSHKSNVLLKSEILSPNRTMRFSIVDGDPVVLDGGGFSLKFPQLKTSVISIADGQTVVFKNILFEGFYPEHISLGIGSSIVFGDNAYVLMGGDATLGYNLDFQGNAVLCGSGNVLTLGREGLLGVAPEKTLRLTDISIRGLSANGGRIVHQASTSVVLCVGVDLQLDSNYSFSVGTVQFVGSQSQVITGPNILTFSGTGKLIVDGVSLCYDTLSAPDTHNIRPWEPDGIFFEALNGGKIRPISSFEKEGDLLLDLRLNKLDQDQSLSVHRRVLFRGQRAFGSVLELDGAGFSVQMPRLSKNIIVVPDGKSVTLKNLVLRDLSPDHIQLGVDSSLTFGDGVLLQLSEDCSLTTTWRFAGKAVIDGRYKNLSLGSSSSGAGIIVDAGAYLRILNTNISGLSGDKISLVDDKSYLEFMSSIIFLSGNCTVTSGSIAIANDVYLQGAHSCFSFVSTGTFLLKRGANLYLDSDVSLLYDASAIDRSQFVFEDSSSRLSLHNARLLGGPSGLVLDGGTLDVSGISALNGLGVDEAHALVIQDNFNVKVQIGATLELLGTIVCSK